MILFLSATCVMALAIQALLLGPAFFERDRDASSRRSLATLALGAAIVTFVTAAILVRGADENAVKLLVILIMGVSGATALLFALSYGRFRGEGDAQ